MQKVPEQSVILNICVVPPQEVGKECVGISQSLKSGDTMFVLDGQTKFSHMTVFMARFPLDQIQNVVEAARSVVAGISSFPCDHTGYFVTKGRYFEVSYGKSAPFVDFHEKLIAALKDFRINPGQPFEEAYFTPYTSEQQQNARDTGYDLAHGLFRPHITLTRYYEGKVPSAYPKTPDINLSFPLGTVCVYKADDNGAVYEKLAEFSV